MTNKKHLANFVSALCVAFEKKITPEIFYVYELVLRDREIDFPSLTKTCLETFDKMPRPKDVLNLLKPEKIEMTHKQKGNMIVGEVKIAVIKYGYPNAKQAMDYLSSEAKSLVYSLGGWESTCKYEFENPIRYAQARDLAEVKAIEFENGENGFIELDYSRDRSKDLSLSSFADVLDKSWGADKIESYSEIDKIFNDASDDIQKSNDTAEKSI